MQTTSGKFFECYYGQSGTGKSESIVALIIEIYKTTGKLARVWVGDGSRATYMALEDAGIAIVYDYTIFNWPLTTLTKVCTGHVPLEPDNPDSKWRKLTAEEYAQTGITVLEGLAVASTYIMGDKRGGFAEMASRGVKIAGDNPVKLVDALLDAAGNPIKDSGPGTTFGGITLGGYGAAQKRMLGFIEHSKGLPGMVIWTTHERLAEEKNSNSKIFGPEVAGGALTVGLSKYFNDTLHFATAVKTAKVDDKHTGAKVNEVEAEFRIYTVDHFAAEGTSFVKYKVVSRHPDPQGKLYGAPLPKFLTSDTPGESILEFYRIVRKAREGQKAFAMKMQQKAA